MKIYKLIYITLAGSVLLACEQQARSYTMEQAKAICHDKMRDAQGPRTNVTMGANSRTGGFGGVSVQLSDSYLRGLDPQEVYDECMAKLPIRGRTESPNSASAAMGN